MSMSTSVHPGRRSVESAKSEGKPSENAVARLTAKILEEMSVESPFFASKPPLSVPLFDTEEICLGDVLGEGEFGTVREVEEFKLAVNFDWKKHAESALSTSMRQIVDDFDLDSGDGSELSLSAKNKLSKLEKERILMKELSTREGQARYAVKRIREGLEGDQVVAAICDLACEAKFLSSISHPNIIRLRGASGTPGYSDFTIILDRLYLTLEQKIELWKTECASMGEANCFGCTSMDLNGGLVDRIIVAYDIVRALNFLHERKVVYRDLKPPNLGFDVRGDVRLFDFGVAKELKRSALIERDVYDLTPMTGTRRYMAPEVCLSKPYGLKADVYSYSLLLWQLCTFELPYGPFITPTSHLNRVVMGKERPPIPSFLSKPMRDLLKSGWDDYDGKRPTLAQMCKALSKEIEDMNKRRRSSIIDRTLHLRANSTSSLRNALQRAGLSSHNIFRSSIMGRKPSVMTKKQLTLDEVERKAFRALTIARTEELDEAWEGRMVLDGSIKCEMPQTWTQAAGSLLLASSTKGIWVDDHSSILLEIETRQRLTDNIADEEVTEVVFRGVTNLCGSDDESQEFWTVQQPSLKNACFKDATICCGKGSIDVPALEEESGDFTLVEVEICVVRLTSERKDVILLAAGAYGGGETTKTLSPLFCRFLESLQV